MVNINLGCHCTQFQIISRECGMVIFGSMSVEPVTLVIHWWTFHHTGREFVYWMMKTPAQKDSFSPGLQPIHTTTPCLIVYPTCLQHWEWRLLCEYVITLTTLWTLRSKFSPDTQESKFIRAPHQIGSYWPLHRLGLSASKSTHSLSHTIPVYNINSMANEVGSIHEVVDVILCY